MYLDDYFLCWSGWLVLYCYRFVLVMQVLKFVRHFIFSVKWSTNQTWELIFRKKTNSIFCKMFDRTKHGNWFFVKRKAFSIKRKAFSVKGIPRQPNSLNTFSFPENSISRKYLFSRKYFTWNKHSISPSWVWVFYFWSGWIFLYCYRYV